MSIKVRQSSLGRVSTVCLAAAVCWVFLLPLGDFAFFMPEDLEDPIVSHVLLKMTDLVQKEGQKLVDTNLDRVIRRFTSEVVLSMEAAANRTMSRESYLALADAIRDAVGPDIVVDMVRSQTRRTAAIQDNDMDLQVRRGDDSGRRNEPFTDDDREKVARNIEKLNSVTSRVESGHVAIKFEMENKTNVDLVLWRPRGEEFPRLRGGDDFYENSARINEFLEQTPAARAAIIGVKIFKYGMRPKGLLLEAIAWRLSKTCPFPLTRTAPVFAGSEQETWKLQEECFEFFRYVLQHLVEWEASPFGGDLNADLALLPERKQAEHLVRFIGLKYRKNRKGCSYFGSLLVVDILRKAQEKWTTQNGRHGPLPWYLVIEFSKIWLHHDFTPSKVFTREFPPRNFETLRVWQIRVKFFLIPGAPCSSSNVGYCGAGDDQGFKRRQEVGVPT